MGVTIKLRGGTAAEWTAANPILADREIGLETDTQKYKVGDGVTAWGSLPYWTDAQAPAGHDHDADYSPTGHTHPYSPDTHNHDADYAASGHTHDSRYYTETEVDSALAGKAGVSHTHPGGNMVWEQISTQAASGASMVEFTSGILDYDAYMVLLNNIVPDTDEVDLYMRISTDGGSTWKSGASDYKWSGAGETSNNNQSYNWSNSDAQYRLTGPGGSDFRMGNSTGEHLSGRVFVHKPSSASYYSIINAVVGFIAASAVSARVNTTGAYAGGVGAINGLQFFASSGTISGDFTLYGLKVI